MKKHEVLKALESITEMSNTEMRFNCDFIREVSLAAYGLLKQKERRMTNEAKHRTNRPLQQQSRAGCSNRHWSSRDRHC